MIKNVIVFSGSGVNFGYHLGGYQKIYKKYDFDTFKGTSGGSIIAALMAYGHNPFEIEDIITKLIFKDYLDFDINFLDGFGFYKGDLIEKFIDDLLPLSFKNIKNDLYIYATDITEPNNPLFIFSKETTPDIKLSKAIRCSMSIPYLFDSVKFRNKILIDGGIIKNFPIDLESDESSNSLGFIIEPNYQKHSELTFKNKIDEFCLYNQRLFEYYTRDNETNSISRASKATIIKLKTDTNAFDLNQEPKVIKEMIRSGFKQTSDFFNSKN